MVSSDRFYEARQKNTGCAFVKKILTNLGNVSEVFDDQLLGRLLGRRVVDPDIFINEHLSKTNMYTRNPLIQNLTFIQESMIIISI